MISAPALFRPPHPLDRMRRLAYATLALLAACVLSIGTALIFFDPPRPPPLDSIAAPFVTMDYSRLPATLRYAARDGAQLAYRAYPAPGAAADGPVAVLVHGSSGSGRGMHAMAEYLQGAGISAYTLDMRGHGESGPRGDIPYIGQLEDDLEDFVARVLAGRSNTALVGHSSGGGFALRFAAGGRQKLFSRYVLFAPYLGYDAPTVRPANQAWVNVSVPRIVALSVLGSFGEKRLGHLPVVRFAVTPAREQYQTPWYSFRLWASFQAHRDFRADIRAAAQRLDVIVGSNDELFDAAAFAPLFAGLRPATTVTVLPGLTHMTLTTMPAGAQALAELLKR